MINFKENYHFSRFHRGSNSAQSGPDLCCLPEGIKNIIYLFIKIYLLVCLIRFFASHQQSFS